MTTLNVSCPQHIGFLELFPGIFSLYSTREIIETLSRDDLDALGVRGTILDFNCSQILASALDHKKNPRLFLPWCLLRCLEVAEETELSVAILCDPETRQYLKPVLSLALSIHRDRKDHKWISVSTLPVCSAL